jgi:predicted amino acid-binding ACT domain protein
MTKLTEEQIRVLAKVAREELGDEATLDRMREVVGQAVEQLEEQMEKTADFEPMGRILAIFVSNDGLRNSRALSDAVKETSCRILERSERTLEDFHTLMAVIDVSNCVGGFDSLRQRLSRIGNEANVRIMLQPEEALRGRSNKI